ncbi:alpha/beta fold hydrolase [Ilumatobacter sp.]|uniref:alpha/beta fold hydrolase n=1 Tax=Ilumatobacter sp. TaxID=1967498 RepID=UPI003AF896A9
MSARPDGRYSDRLVFLHGFTQTHHHWHRVALALGDRSGRATTLAFVDLPGHGLSTHDRTGIAPAAIAAAGLGGAGTYIGYSMGGRVALLAALARPDLVERLVLIGATAGIDDEHDRATRRASDDDRATRVEHVGVGRFLDEWLAAEMFADLPADHDGLAHRQRNTAAGLAHSLRTGGTGRQPSVWGRLHEIEVPALVLAGANDTKFVDLGERLAEGLPHADFVTIADAGHAAHVESPRATVDVIAGWLADG